TAIHPLSLHDALPIWRRRATAGQRALRRRARRERAFETARLKRNDGSVDGLFAHAAQRRQLAARDRVEAVRGARDLVLARRLRRSEEHTSELLSLAYL